VRFAFATRSPRGARGRRNLGIDRVTDLVIRTLAASWRERRRGNVSELGRRLGSRSLCIVAGVDPRQSQRGGNPRDRREAKPRQRPGSSTRITPLPEPHARVPDDVTNASLSAVQTCLRWGRHRPRRRLVSSWNRFAELAISGCTHRRITSTPIHAGRGRSAAAEISAAVDIGCRFSSDARLDVADS